MNGVRTRVYRNGVLDAEGFPLEDVSDHLDRGDCVVWVDVVSPSDDVLRQLTEEFSLHELAVEDAASPHQRPKLDRYEDHLFLSSHAVWFDIGSGELAETEVDAFVNRDWLITVRKNDRFDIRHVEARWDRSPDLAKYGVSFLLYGVLDVIVDGYSEAIQTFDDYYDRVSEGLFAERPLDPSQYKEWFEVRRAMVRFHRLVVPMREVISRLMRRENSPISEELQPYFQDVYDHVLRVSESSETLRDLVATIAETNLALRDYRQNLIVKKVSSWAAIGLVPTLITGFFGMNVPYPGSGEPSGVAAAVAVMVVSCVGLYSVFRAKDWL